jgi:CheY-like chemotaxis protein
MARRILIIEDNPANMELMEYLLRASGFEVIAEHDGPGGIDAARRLQPDLIVCDVHLPKMDGLEIVRQLKAAPPLAKVPIVAVTALAMVGDRERLLAAGFDAYIGKPIDPETFAADMEALISGPRNQERAWQPF